MARARSVTHPILKARYAYLVWDVGPVIADEPRHPDTARVAIDAYLASLGHAHPPDLHARIGAASRALALATLINDAQRIDVARTAMMVLHREAVTARSQWWDTFDRLIDNKRAGLTDTERTAQHRRQARKAGDQTAWHAPKCWRLHQHGRHSQQSGGCRCPRP